MDYHQKFGYITKMNPKENPRHSGVLDDDHYLEHGEGENSSLDVIPNINHRTSGMRTSVFQVQEHSIQHVEQSIFSNGSILFLSHNIMITYMHWKILLCTSAPQEMNIPKHEQSNNSSNFLVDTVATYLGIDVEEMTHCKLLEHAMLISIVRHCHHCFVPAQNLYSQGHLSG